LPRKLLCISLDLNTCAKMNSVWQIPEDQKAFLQNTKKNFTCLERETGYFSDMGKCIPLR